MVHVLAAQALLADPLVPPQGNPSPTITIIIPESHRLRDYCISIICCNCLLFISGQWAGLREEVQVDAVAHRLVALCI